MWLIEQLLRDGFDLTVAFWVKFKFADDPEWFFYLVSKTVDERGLQAAYLAVNTSARRLPPPWGPWLSTLEIKLVNANEPVAKDVLAFRARYPGRKWFRGITTGNQAIEGIGFSGHKFDKSCGFFHRLVELFRGKKYSAHRVVKVWGARGELQGFFYAHCCS